MNRYDELSTDCQQAVDKVINTIAALGCSEKAAVWLTQFRGRIMEYYNFFIPRAKRQFLVDELDRGW
jgi:hypothetical protein